MALIISWDYIALPMPNLARMTLKKKWKDPETSALHLGFYLMDGYILIFTEHVRTLSYFTIKNR
jgi:hypothetical protein